MHIPEVVFAQHSHSFVGSCLVQERHRYIQVPSSIVPTETESESIGVTNGMARPYYYCGT